MARLRTSSLVVSYAARTEGMEVRAADRTFGKSHTTIMRWEKRLADQVEHWSPPAPAGSDVTVKGDEVYESSPPSQSQSWTIHFLERESRYWFTAQAGLKDEQLFANGVQGAWEWVKACDEIRWFTVRVACQRLRRKTLWTRTLEAGQRLSQR